MMWRMIRTIIILPGTALVIVPGVILSFTASAGFAGALAGPGQPQFWAGLLTLGFGLFFGIWTARLFVTIGMGTPAPWDPPRKLVVKGPYRHVRNPMITSVLFMLLGESLLLQSWPLVGWGIFFFAANAIYFPLSEEKGLERRFGQEYRMYKKYVPRWAPRIRPWEP